MIAEFGQRSDFKASVLETCTDYPQPGEVYVCTRVCSVAFDMGDEILVTGYGWSVRFANMTRRTNNHTVSTDIFIKAVYTGALKFAGYVN